MTTTPDLSRPRDPGPPLRPPRWLAPLDFLALALIAAYRVGIRPLLVGSCKFHPHCSDYAAEAIRKYGTLAGGRLAIKRILRCRPGAIGGLDPVP